jgi:hypothetical protein
MHLDALVNLHSVTYDTAGGGEDPIHDSLGVRLLRGGVAAQQVSNPTLVHALGQVCPARSQCRAIGVEQHKALKGD